MEWFGVFASNIAAGLFWPFVVATVTSVIAIIWCQTIKDRYQYGSAQYSGASWTQHTALQGTVIAWFLWAILNAVPQPDYTVKQVEVVKRVSVMDDFAEAYNKCMDARQHRDYCTKLAEKTSGVVKLAPTKKVVRTVYRIAPPDFRYKNLYTTCMNGASIPSHETKLRAQVSKTCSADARAMAMKMK
jgi:hypothetical protein